MVQPVRCCRHVFGLTTHILLPYIRTMSFSLLFHFTRQGSSSSYYPHYTTQASCCWNSPYSCHALNSQRDKMYPSRIMQLACFWTKASSLSFSHDFGSSCEISRPATQMQWLGTASTSERSISAAHHILQSLQQPAQVICEITHDSKTFCVSSSPSFAGDRGLSVITTPDRMHTVLSTPSLVCANTASPQRTSSYPRGPAFEEREIPGKGRGLISTRELHRGDSIFAWPPVLLVDSDLTDDLEPDQWISLESNAVDKLPLSTREKVWDLYGESNTYPINDRIDSNAFEIEVDDHLYFALYPETAVSCAS